MNIYFSCSITGGRNDQRIYRMMVDHLLELGHEVPTAMLADAELSPMDSMLLPEEVFRRDDAWVRHCDALIAEVTTPSHGVGYEIALALFLEKPVLCCYQAGKTISKMILGNPHPKIVVRSYRSSQEATHCMEDFLAGCRKA